MGLSAGVQRRLDPARNNEQTNDERLRPSCDAI